MDKRIQSEAMEWTALCGQLLDQFPHLAAIFGQTPAALKSKKVLRLKLPYGLRLIKDGKFQWTDIPLESFTREDFAANAIPLGLVLDRSIELFDEIRIEREATSTRLRTRPKSTVHRAVPLVLLKKGDFFGLFQAFCGDFPQPQLQATAGGTTLVLIPRIGNVGDLTDYAEQRGFSAAFPYADDLRCEDKSGFSFGRMFSDVLSQSQCDWRLEVILFPDNVVRQLRQLPSANEALLMLALNQMRLSHDRSQSEIDLLRSAGGSGHVLASRMIAHALRPGFCPVFDSEEDRTVLPAECIYDFVYGLAPGEPRRGKRERTFPNAPKFFPAVFRPSLANEPSFYFLNWPYLGVNQAKDARVSEHIRDIVALNHPDRKYVFRSAMPPNLAEILTEDATRRSGLAAMQPIRLGEGADEADKDKSSYFVVGGVVYITRK